MEDSIKKAARCAVCALEDKKGEEITVLDISEISSLADCFIICSGSNRNQVQALSDNVEEALAKEGFRGNKSEGYESANLILLDYKDFVIHIFDEENRSFYDLERTFQGKKLL